MSWWSAILHIFKLKIILKGPAPSNQILSLGREVRDASNPLKPTQSDDSNFHEEVNADKAGGFIALTKVGTIVSFQTSLVQNLLESSAMKTN